VKWTVPADATLTAGTGTFSATLQTAGNQSITETDTANAAITGTSNAVSVPSPPGNATFLGQLFLSLLQRPIDSASMSAFSAALDAGTLSRFQLILGIVTSPEYQTFVVKNLYQQVLGRAADSGGLAGGVAFLAAGHSPAELEAALFASPEYAQNHPGDGSQDVLGALYQALLGQPADPTTLEQFLANGATTAAAAEALATSAPVVQNLITTDYQTYLGRAPESAGMTAWQNFVADGNSAAALLAGILSSDEYFNRL
jgi:hypothetical protein